MADFTIRDTNPEWGQDTRIYDATGDLVLTVGTECRPLAEAEEITRRVCAALNGQDRAATLLRDLEWAADHTTAPLDEGRVNYAYTLGRVQQVVRGHGGEVPR